MNTVGHSDILSPDVVAEANECQAPSELTAPTESKGVELSDDDLDDVSGGEYYYFDKKFSCARHRARSTEQLTRSPALFNVVLVEPEIPANTGNIGRTCVLTGSRLHLVAPAFDLSDKALKRAGLAYWQSLDLQVYSSWSNFLMLNPQAALAFAEDHPTPNVHLLTKSGARVYAESHYSPSDYLVFGKESAGLDAQMLNAHPHLCERIPMLGDDTLINADAWHASHDRLNPEIKRDICGNYVDEREGQVTSLNLSNAVAIVLYEALRQTGFAGM